MPVAPLPIAPELAWLDAAEAALLIADEPSVPAEVSRAAVARIARLESVLAARKMTHIRNVEAAELAKQPGATSTSALIAHDCILPRVLDGKSQILDLGRAQRLFTPAQRLAMADRDGGCTYPGNGGTPARRGMARGRDRLPAWTEAHHWVHAQHIHIRQHANHTEYRINGIWQTNPPPSTFGAGGTPRWRP